MSKTDKSVELMAEVLKTAKVIGYNKTLEANIAARNATGNAASQEALNKKNQNQIIQKTCELFNIAEKELFTRHSRHLQRKPAITVLWGSFVNDMHFDRADIAILFDVHFSLVYRVVTEFNALNPTNVADKCLLDKYQQLKEFINTKIKK